MGPETGGLLRERELWSQYGFPEALIPVELPQHMPGSVDFAGTQEPEDLRFFVWLLELGTLNAVSDRQYALAEAVEAHRHAESGKKRETSSSPREARLCENDEDPD
jgi:hypothetical protein